MPHPKTPDINWHEAAWELSAMLTIIPYSNKLFEILSNRDKESKVKSLDEDVIDAIEELINNITLRLAYRLQVCHLANKKLKKGAIDLNNRDSRETHKAIKIIESGGIVLNFADCSAFDAHIMLSQILRDGYSCPEWTRTLPLTVAAIGGVTTSQSSTLKAKNTRTVDRRSSVSKAVAKIRRSNRNDSASEILHALCGGDVIKECINGRVYYWDEKDKLQSMGLDRFDNIFAEQKPSMG